MQATPTGWPTNLDVTTPTATATVEGVNLPVHSASVTRELGTMLNGKVAGGGLMAATGEVVLSAPDGATITSRVPNPWTRPGGFPPAPGDAVAVTMGYGDAQVRVLTGALEPGSGGSDRATVSMGTIDGIDRLNRTVSIEALANAMPPRTDGGEYRYIYLAPTYFTDRILRECGFYATPPQVGGVLVSAPLMGSAWPERGVLSSSKSADAGSNTPSFASGSRVPWGMAAGSLDAYYAPATTETYDGKLTSAITLTVCVGYHEAATAGGSVQALWGSATNRLYVSVDANRNVRAAVSVAGTSTVVATLTGTTGAEVFSARYDPDGTVTLRASNGQTATGSWVIPAHFTTTAVTDLWVLTGHGTSHPIGGVQLSHTSSDGAVTFTRTAHLTTAAHRFSLQGSPALVNRNALDILREQANAEFAALRIDEHGHARWTNRNELVTGSPVTELTTDVDLQSLEWEDPPAPPGRVEVTWQRPEASLSTHPNITVWQGSSQTFDAHQTEWVFIRPPSGEDWLEVDTVTQYAGEPTGGDESFNRGYGSWVGGYAVAADGGYGGAWFNPAQGHGQMSISQVDPATWEFTADIYTLVAPVAQITTEVNPYSPGVWDKWHGAALPLLRAKGKIAWNEYTYTADAGNGSPLTLTHDVGWWVQDAAAVAELRDWILARATDPAPVVRDVPLVVPDPRLQLGDIVTIRDRHLTGMTLTVLVAGIHLTYSEDPDSIAADQSLTGVVLAAAHAYPTLGDHDRVWAGATLTALDGEFFGDTLATLDNNPLRRTT